MIQGVYRAAAAMLSEMLRQDIHSNNLANTDTTGFKRSLARVVQGTGQQAGSLVVSGIDLSLGDLKQTAEPLDVALRSSGYFVVDTGRGLQYTRNGHFTLDGQGNLVNSQGGAVLGLRGPIRLTGSRLEIAQDGNVYSDGAFVDKLMVVDFPAQANVQRDAGSSVVGTRPPTAVQSYALASGALEASNANPIAEMGAMTNGFRIYEANAKTLGQLDNTLGKLIEAATS